MSMQQQEQAQARKRFRWTRLIIAIAVLLLLAAVTLIWILSYGHVISRDLASILTIIFTVLTIAVPFYLWLFPITTNKSNPPVVAPSQLTPQPSSPGPIPEQPSLPETLPSTWNVPSRRNPFFTGREDILKRLHETLTTGKATALTQPQAISGLGGIGKTQTAVEYAYRYRDDYQYVLWASADTREALVSGFVTIAGLLNLPEKDAQDQNLAVNAVKGWLQTHTGWLLILDNADDLAMARDFLPPAGKGHTLLTTRAQAMGTLAQSVAIEKMEPEEGALFLLHRARIIAQDALLENASAADRAIARNIVEAMDGLPLALDQAGAYIEETRCSLSNYLALYQKQRTELLKRRGGVASDHPVPVASTWSLSFQKIEQANPAAADILRLCAFLSSDAIPEEIITEGAPDLGPAIQSVAADPLKVNEAIGELLKYSLVRRNPDQTLTVHRLVQAVLKDEMNKKKQRQWAERTVRAVNRVFPRVEYTTWPQCRRYLPHARVCAALIEQWDMALPEAGRLLNQVGWYLRERALYAEAEPFSRRALAIREQVLGPEHLDVTNSLSNLALLYKVQGKYAEAEPLYQQDLAISEKVLGSEHSEVATSLNNLAVLYRAQGKYTEAEPLYQRALAIDEKALGQDHPDVATDLNNLALLYEAQGKYTEAEPLYQRALAIWEKALGAEHPYVATSFNNLALLYLEQGKYGQAEPLYQRALAIVEKALGPEHPNMAFTLNNLAVLYRAQGKYGEAEPLYQRALAIDEKALEQEHPDVATDLNNLALLYYHQGKYAEAEPLYQRALAIWEKALGPEHPEVASGLENYAALLRKTKREAEAAKREARAREIRARHARENPPESG